tara:strand:- start:26 stop:526 length:501 start_codon:yes stop_codon:yes gene_type:complete
MHIRTILQLSIIVLYALLALYIRHKPRRWLRVVSSVMLFFWSTCHSVFEGVVSITSWSDVSTWTDTYIMGLVFNTFLFLGSVVGSAKIIRWMVHGLYLAWGFIWVLCTLDDASEANIQRQIWYPAGMVLAATLVFDDRDSTPRDPMVEYRAALMGGPLAYIIADDA